MRYDRDHPLTVVELFAGYGSQHLALRYLGEDYPDFHFKVLAVAEIEPAAIKAYRALHGDCPNLGDITRIDWARHPELRGCGLVTYSFPCQDISNAGKQRGFAKGSGSRSSLLWECERCFRELRPRMLLLENVKALVQKKFMSDFKEWLDVLDSLGYTTLWKVLNAKDYNEPQNRERVFAVSILRECPDDEPAYNFPAPMPLTLCVEDIMVPVEEVPEDAYIPQDRVTGKVLSDILDQSDVRAEMERLYQLEWAFFREHGRFPKDGEI